MKKAFFLVFIVMLSPLSAFSSKNMLLPLNHKEFKSKHLTFTPKVTLYLPADYKTSGRSYPVLYALDGQNLFESEASFSGEWRLDENILSLQKQGLLDEIIVVAVHNTSRRMYDYTPTFADTEDFGSLGGDLDKFGRFLVTELKPYIDSHFPTKTGREDTGIMGSSLGGLSSFYLLGWYPQIFSKAGVISPSFWWDDLRVLKDMKKMSFPDDVKIYMDGGWREDRDQINTIRDMKYVCLDLLKISLKTQKNIFYYEDMTGSHTESMWAKRGTMPILFMYGNFDPAVRSVDLEIDPSILVQDIPSRMLFQLQSPNAMTSTVLEPIVKVVPPTAAAFQNGLLLPTQAGPLHISLLYGSKTYSYDLEILANIMEIYHRLIRVESVPAVQKITLNVVVIDKMTTNISLPMKTISDKNSQLAISKKKNTKIKFVLINDKGQFAYSKSGKKIIKTLSFREHKSFTIKVYDWK